MAASNNQQMTKRRPHLIMAALVVVNLGGLAVFAAAKSLRNASMPVVTVTQAAPPAEQPATSGNRAVARALRASGLVALESGEYTRAAEQFGRALEIEPTNGELRELTLIASDLRDRTGDAVAQVGKGEEGDADDADEAVHEEPAKPEETKVSLRSQREATRLERARKKEKEKAQRLRVAQRREAQPPAETTGTVVVSSTPSGLEVHVDGEARGSTPLRLTLPAGAHTVEIVRDGERVYERRVSTEAGSFLAFEAEVAPKKAPEPPKKGLEPRPPEPTVQREEPAAIAAKANATGLNSDVEQPAPKPPAEELPADKQEPAKATASSGLVVLAHAGLAASRVRTADLSALYMGTSTTLGATPVTLVMRPLGSESTVALFGRIGTTQRRFRDQWAKVSHYEGRSAPRVISSTEAIASYIAATPGAMCVLLASEAEAVSVAGTRKIPVQ